MPWDWFLNNITAVPYIFEIVIFVLLFELALIVFLNNPFPVFPFFGLVKLERILVNMPVPELLAYGLDQMLSHNI